MNFPGYRQCVSGAPFIGVFAACSNGGNPIGPTAVFQAQNATISGGPKGALLYVSDPIKNIVSVYSYPQGVLLSTLTAVQDPEGLCADSAGNIWVVESVYSKIVEFARGGTKPNATLTDGGEYPDGCAVNRKNGDLAVANNNNGGSDPGSVAIYEGARGTPAIYSDRAIWFVYFLDYDTGGNLFVDGTSWTNRGRQFRYAELPRGASNLINIRSAVPKSNSPVASSITAAE